MDKLLTTTEAAKFLNLKKNTLEVWRVQGKGPAFVKLNRACRYRMSVLEQYIESSTRTSTSHYVATI